MKDFMKPWLLDILACPLDKYFPLKLYVFSYETTPEEFKELLNIRVSPELAKKEKIVEIISESGKLYLKDNLIIERNTIETYLNQIVSSIKEMDNIIDKSSNEYSKQCLSTIQSEVKMKIENFSRNIKVDQIEKLLPELVFLNKIKIETEIESGLLFCEKCLRWFPIIETIPQMLPDEYRDKKKEIEFLKTNKNLLEDEFFKQDLKPFKI